MIQPHLPLFPEDMSFITTSLGFCRQNNKVIYFSGGMPIFTHAADDHKTFRMITSQFCANGNCKQMDIVRAFGVSKESVKRYTKKYREEGAAGFYKKRNARGTTVITEGVIKEAQQLLNEGNSVTETAKQLTIKRDTLQKSIRAGKLTQSESKKKKKKK